MARGRNSRPTDRELTILRILWDNGPSPVREVNEAMNEEEDIGYTTTLKLMQIMIDKGLLRRNSVHFYLDELSPGDGGGNDDSVAELLQTIGNHVNMVVVDDTEASEETAISFCLHRSSRFLRQMKNSPEKTEKLQVFLANISKQTELQFKFKKQSVDIWFVTEVEEN